MLIVKHAEDIIPVMLLNCLFFLLCIYNVSAHEQEDKKTLQRGLEKNWNWARIDREPAIKMITVDRSLEREAGKTSSWQERKFVKFLFRPRKTVSSADLLLGLRFPLNLWVIWAFCH